ncbi:hypothetical protein L0Y40_02850 [Candidatus Wolfebacteria bacterium]|nr:hypothetical protein [Candidatus Wolfebacteria bacterium]
MNKAKNIFKTFPHKDRFLDVLFLKDPGFDTTCKLPYFARGHLENEFLYEFGHNISMLSHYTNLISAKQPHEIVFSAFKPDLRAHHPVLLMDNEEIIPLESLSGVSGEYNLGSPYIFDQEYIATLPKVGFNTKMVIKFYASQRKLSVVESSLPSEFNFLDELNRNFPLYKNYLQREYEFLLISRFFIFAVPVREGCLWSILEIWHVFHLKQ